MPIDLKASVYAATKKEAVPIFQIAKECELSVQTASKYCHILAAEHKIEITKYGNMKLVRRKA